MNKIVKVAFFVFFTIFIILYSFLAYCSKKYNLEIDEDFIFEKRSEFSFGELIKIIQNQIELNILKINIKEYRIVCYYANDYLEEAIKLLQNENLCNEEKSLIIEMMHGLNYEKYLKFFHACTDLFVEGKLSDSEMMAVITMNTEFNQKVIKSFYKPKVMRDLLRIYIKSSTPDLDLMVKLTFFGIIWLFVLIDPPTVYHQNSLENTSNTQ